MTEQDTVPRIARKTIKQERINKMEDKNNVEIVSPRDYHLYNLVIERLAKVIPELRCAIANCEKLEDNGFDMELFLLQGAMIDISAAFAEIVAGQKYVKPSESETKE